MTDWESRVPPPWEPPAAGSEVEHLVGALDRQRATFRWKADGLDAAALRTGIGSSSLTLAGLLKHLALVEDHYFGAAIPGRTLDERWPVDAMRADPDWEFVSALDDEPADLYALYDGAVVRARAALAKALADGGLDRPVDRGWPDGRMPSLRRVLFDLVEEYSRHTGHADLLREAVDGRTGEDPPDDWQPPF
jgi:hypothetical protein